MNIEYNFKEPKEHVPPEPMPLKAVYWYSLQDSYLLSRNLDYNVARYNQWYPTDLKGPRVVIPCTQGFWQARAMEEDEPRYLSSRGSRNGAFCVVWPLITEVIDRVLPPPTLIVEGPMDALAAAALGAVGIASLGAGFGGYVVDWVCKNRL